MTTFDELLAIDWPDEFLVEYPDGSKALLLRNDGVALMPPGDDPEGCGALSAGLPKKHPRNQKQGNRLIRFSELRGSTPEMDVGFGRRVDLASGAMPTLAVGMRSATTARSGSLIRDPAWNKPRHPRAGAR